MGQTSLSVWFECRLCRGSFGQVDAFIEHKKQKHFTQFQNTTSIVFEESEHGELGPVIIKAENQLVDENTEPRVKIELTDENASILFNSETIDDPNLDLVEPETELITYESEGNPENENNFFGLEPPQPNPYVLLKRLTSEEIQNASRPDRHCRLLKCEPKDFVSNSEPPNLCADVDSNIRDLTKVEKSTDNQPSATVTNISKEADLQFECKLCSKQLQSEAQLKIHVGICALYHEDRNRFCVTCNRKLFDTKNLKEHRVRFHGTEEEKLSLFKFKCHICPKKYRKAGELSFHLKSHKEMSEQVKASNFIFFKCSHPNCGKEFQNNYKLRKHIDGVHLNLRPFSCSFPNCIKTFTQRVHMEKHFMIHTGERPFKCTVEHCNKAFITFNDRSRHLLTVHR